MAPSIGALEREGRLERARRLLADSGADALLIGAGASLRYFAGVPWGASERLVAMLLPLVGDPIVICPRFELGTLEADLAVEADVRLWEEDESPSMLLAGALRELRVATLAVDPATAFSAAPRSVGEESVSTG